MKDGIDPMAHIQDIAGRMDNMQKRAEIEKALHEVEDLFEEIDPEQQGPVYEIIKQLFAKLGL